MMLCWYFDIALVWLVLCQDSYTEPVWDIVAFVVE